MKKRKPTKRKIKRKSLRIKNIACAGVYGDSFWNYDGRRFTSMGGCREGFAASYASKARIGWSCSYAMSCNIKRLLIYCERRLKLKEKSTYTHYYYGYNNIMIIKVSPFWRRSPLRMSLLSAIIKGGRYYKNKKIIGLPYIGGGNTNKAFNRFLQGYTICSNVWYGWVDTFHYQDTWKQLRKPNGAKVG